MFRPIARSDRAIRGVRFGPARFHKNRLTFLGSVWHPALTGR